MGKEKDTHNINYVYAIKNPLRSKKARLGDR